MERNGTEWNGMEGHENIPLKLISISSTLNFWKTSAVFRRFGFKADPWNILKHLDPWLHDVVGSHFLRSPSFDAWPWHPQFAQVTVDERNHDLPSLVIYRDRNSTICSWYFMVNYVSKIWFCWLHSMHSGHLTFCMFASIVPLIHLWPFSDSTPRRVGLQIAPRYARVKRTSNALHFDFNLIQNFTCFDHNCSVTSR